VITVVDVEEVLCTSKRGECVYPSTCKGTLTSYNCPSDNNHKCYIDHISNLIEAYEHFINGKGNIVIANKIL